MLGLMRRPEDYLRCTGISSTVVDVVVVGIGRTPLGRR